MCTDPLVCSSHGTSQVLRAPSQSLGEVGPSSALLCQVGRPDTPGLATAELGAWTRGRCAPSAWLPTSVPWPKPENRQFRVRIPPCFIGAQLWPLLMVWLESKEETGDIFRRFSDMITWDQVGWAWGRGSYCKYFLSPVVRYRECVAGAVNVGEKWRRKVCCRILFFSSKHNEKSS